MEIILKVRQLRKRFGGLTAVDGVDFDVSEGTILSLIGPNGAGKTTLFDMLSGVFPPTAGTITFRENEIARRGAHHIARLGISRTFQNIRLFANMTVLQNVMVGRHCRTHTGFLSAALRLPACGKEERATCDAAMRALEFVGLEENAGDDPTALPFDQQRLLEIARALATGPRLLLLDEPAAGLNVRESGEMSRCIVRIRDAGITVLLVEHVMPLVMDISDRVVVLDAGKLIAKGAPGEIRNNPDVIRVYLGSESC